MDQNSLVFQLSVAKNRIRLSHIQLILGPFMSQKTPFLQKKAAHCGGALLKKRNHFSLYFLNGKIYLKIFNRFEFQEQYKYWMKIKSTL